MSAATTKKSTAETLGDLTKVEVSEKKELAVKKSEYDEIVAELRDVTILDEDDFQYFSGFLRSVKAYAKEIDTRRKRVTDPLNAALKEFRSWYSPVLDTLEEAERILKKKIGDYHIEQEKKKEEQMRLLAAAAREGDFEKAHEVSANLVDTPSAKGISVARRWEYSIEDLDLVPREYLCLDHSAVKIYLKDCKTEDPKPIPGLKFILVGGVTAR